MSSRMKVLKRSEQIEILDVDKISDSIFLAAQDAGGTDRGLARKLSRQVVSHLSKHYKNLGKVASTEIGDMVERVLLENKHYKTAKAYILNRDKKRKIESQKRALGVYDDVGLSLNALVIMKAKYVQRDENGEPTESVRDVFSRVAKFISGAEKKSSRKKWEKIYKELMVRRRFLPGGRTLANAGTANNQLANCFVMPMPDDIEGIFESLKESSILKKYGGGVGFNFGHIRPKGDMVATTSGAAAGPVALMKLIDDASDIYLQAGKRRSGNMVTLPVTHPDIMEFIHCKDQGNNLPHINYSISVTKKFMDAVANNKDWDLINPRTGLRESTLSARSILEASARLAWKMGDPGLIFIDTINRDNPTAHIAPLETVNLCGEQPLLSYEACNLGSINLASHLKMNKTKSNVMKDYVIDWKLLEQTVKNSVRMLDDVVTVCEYPLDKVAKTVRSNRKIGLGVMGWADMLVRLGIAYDSKEALMLAGKVMKMIRDVSWKESEKLGKEKGSFPNFKGSLWDKRGYKYFRNSTVTTIAPTGSIAMIAGCSSGIEPHFAMAYYRRSMGQYDLPEVNEDLVRTIKFVNGLYSDQLMDEVATSGSIQDIKTIPAKTKKLFVTSMDIDPEKHVQMQARFQKYTDNAVSKTINLPNSATVDDVLDIFILAASLGCKGITVYRDGSRDVQVLNVGSRAKSSSSDNPAKMSVAEEEIASGVCPNCGGKLVSEEGCSKCYGCGFSVC